MSQNSFIEINITQKPLLHFGIKKSTKKGDMFALVVRSVDYKKGKITFNLKKI